MSEIDSLLTVPDGTHRPPLFSLKAYPAEASPPVLLTYLEREQFLSSLGVGTITLRGMYPDVLARFAQLGSYYDAEDLRHFAPTKVTIVHLIDMIAAQDQDVRRIDALQEGEVSTHGIHRSQISPRPHSRRRNGAER